MDLIFESKETSEKEKFELFKKEMKGCGGQSIEKGIFAEHNGARISLLENYNPKINLTERQVFNEAKNRYTKTLFDNLNKEVIM
jgi:hypothetical protein